jgi:hypothetical protein
MTRNTLLFGFLNKNQAATLINAKKTGIFQNLLCSSETLPPLLSSEISHPQLIQPKPNLI